MRTKSRKFFHKVARILLYLIGLLVTAHFIMVFIFRPSLDRNWNKDQKVLAKATFDGDLVSITNIRNINYRSTTDYDIHYYDKTFDISKLESVWYMVEPFTGAGAGAAHALLSFGFGKGNYVSISVEIRKQEGESFSAVKGLFRQYELMYVIADERDVIKLRSNYRKDEVFLFPIETSKENMQKLFISMLKRANKLATKPEFYNTLTNTCTTNIVSHVNEIVPGRIPFSFKVLMPAYSDELAYRLGLFDTTRKVDKAELMETPLTLEELRAKYNINERAMKYADDPKFSERIRE